MGIKATKLPWTEPPMYLKESRWYGPPGAIVNYDPITNGLTVCCPECGQLGSAIKGAQWTIQAGSFDDVSTLTLQPSILKSCCGWHGYLTNGEFVKC